MRVSRLILLSLMTAAPITVGTLASASAQTMMPGFRLNEGKQYTDEEKERMKANEDAAKAARAKVPDAKVSSDPWAGARAAEAPVKAAPKAVKPKAAAQ